MGHICFLAGKTLYCVILLSSFSISDVLSLMALKCCLKVWNILKSMIKWTQISKQIFNTFLKLHFCAVHSCSSFFWAFYRSKWINTVPADKHIRMTEKNKCSIGYTERCLNLVLFCCHTSLFKVKMKKCVTFTTQRGCNVSVESDDRNIGLHVNHAVVFFLWSSLYFRAHI